MQVIDFGDFTMELDPEMPGEMADREEGAVFFTIYPAYGINGDEASNINGVWISEVSDFGAYSEESKAEA